MATYTILHAIVFCYTLMTIQITVTDAEDYRLPKTVTPVTYTVRLNILDVYSEKFTASEVIVFTTTEDSNQLFIHSSPEYINITNIFLNGHNAESCSWEHTSLSSEIVNITCTTKINPEEVNHVQIFYEAMLANRNGNGLYKLMYTENEYTEVAIISQLSPTFARRVFPCFDEPNLKATFNIFITHPQTYQVIGNTPIVAELVGVDGLATTQFDTTPVISTNSIGFVISKFIPVSKDIEGATFVYNVFTKPELKDRTKTVLTYGTEMVNLMGQWTGVKYEEMGNTQIYAVSTDYLPCGQVNNQGLVVAREENVLDEGPDTSAKQKQKIIKTLANQIAHQWFGNYMTSDWWSNIWIYEGFATFFEYHLSNKINNDIELENPFTVNVLQDALYQDSLLGAEELSTGESVLTAADILQKCNKLTATKGASILRMMQMIVGEEKFQESIRSYINKYKFNNTNPSMLLESLGLDNLMETWIYKPRYPLVTVNLNVDNNILMISQEPFFLMAKDVMNLTYWNIPITYATEKNQDFSIKDVIWLNNSGAELKISLQPDSWIILNNQQRGYYRVNYDDVLWNRIISILNGPDRNKIHVLNRAQIIDDIFAIADVGKVSYNTVFKLAGYLKYETEYYPWISALRAMSNLLNHLSNEDTKEKLKKKILSWINEAFPKFSEVKGDNYIDTLKESLLLNWKCLLGDVDCLNMARAKYQDFKSSRSFQNFNERETILCYGIKNTGQPIDEYSFLMKLYQDSKFRIEKEALLTALGCISSNEILWNYLMETLLERSVIPTYDAITVFEAVSSQTNGVAVVLRFLTENVSLLLNRFRGILPVSDFITTIADKISTGEQLEQLKTIIQNNEEIQDNQSIRLLKIIEYNLQWSENHSAEIDYAVTHASTGGAVHTECTFWVFLLVTIYSVMLVK